jgi:hypothetical protein
VVANVAKSAEEAETQASGQSAERQEAEQALAEVTGNA